MYRFFMHCLFYFFIQEDLNFVEEHNSSLLSQLQTLEKGIEETNMASYTVHNTLIDETTAAIEQKNEETEAAITRKEKEIARLTEYNATLAIRRGAADLAADDGGAGVIKDEEGEEAKQDETIPDQGSLEHEEEIAQLQRANHKLRMQIDEEREGAARAARRLMEMISAMEEQLKKVAGNTAAHHDQVRNNLPIHRERIKTLQENKGHGSVISPAMIQRGDLSKPEPGNTRKRRFRAPMYWPFSSCLATRLSEPCSSA